MRQRQKGCEHCFKHCDLKKKHRKPDKPIARISEYMDIISTTGGIITKANLNDHRKCTTELKCRHFYRID